MDGDKEWRKRAMNRALLFFACLFVVGFNASVQCANLSATTDQRGYIWIQRFQGAYHDPGYQVVGFDGHASVVDLPVSGPLSPDGMMIAHIEYVPEGMEVMLVDLPASTAPVNGRAIYHLEFKRDPQRLDPYVHSLQWSPDSAHIVIRVRDTSGGDIYRRILVNRKGEQVYKDQESAFNSDGQWSPDGKAFAFCEDAKRLVLLDPLTGSKKIVHAVDEPTHFMKDPQWAPDGKSVMVHYIRMKTSSESGPADVSIDLIDIVAGHRVTLISDVNPAYSPQWSPDGGSVLFVEPFKKILLLDMATRKVRSLITEQSIEAFGKDEFISLSSPRWSLDGGAIVFWEGVYKNISHAFPERSALYSHDLRSGFTKKLIDAPATDIFEIRSNADKSVVE